MTACAAETARTRSTIDRHQPIEHQLQLTGTTIWKGAVGVEISGKAQPCRTAVANQKLLGVSVGTYGPVSADTARVQPPMIFDQGIYEFPNSTSDPVLTTDIGTTVAFADDNTVKHTNAANDVLVTCKYITPAGMVGVDVRNP